MTEPDTHKPDADTAKVVPDAFVPRPVSRGRRFWRSCRRPAIWCIEGVAMLTGIVVILALAAAWRLSSGPVEIDFLTDEIEAAVSAAAAPMRVEMGAITILWDDRARGLRLAGQSVLLRTETGRLVGSFPRLDIALDIPALLRGHYVITEATLQQPVIRLTRNQTGDIDVDFTTHATAPTDLAAPAPDQDPTMGTDALAMALAILSPPEDQRATRENAPWSRLRQVRITDARFELANPQAGRRFRLNDVSLVVTRGRDGLDLRGEARLSAGDGATAARLTGLVTIRAQDQRLSVDLNLRDIDLTVANRLGFGELAPWLASMPLDQASLMGNINAQRGTFEIEQLAVDLDGTSVQLAASGYRDRPANGPTRWRGAAALRLDRLDVPAWLARFPETLDIGALNWARENVTRGQITGFEVLLDGAMIEGAPASLALDRLQGHFGLEDATVRYQWALPPATDIVGTGRFDKDAVVLNLKDGNIETVKASEVEVRIDQFDAEFPQLVVTGRAQGPFRDVMTAMNHPRFGYADYLGLDLGQLGGTVDAAMRFALPLQPSIPAEAVEADIAGRLIGVKTNALFAGLPIAEANLDAVIDGDGLVAKGTVNAGGIPLTINWHQYFQASAEIGTALDFSGKMTDQHLAALGFDPAPYLTGPIGVDGRIIDYNGGDTDIQATATLDEALLTIPALKLERQSVPGSLLLAVQVKPDSQIVISSASLSTEALNADGAAQIGADGSFAAQINRIALGETRLAASVEQNTDGALDVVLSGPRLDLRPLLDDDAPPSAETAQQGETAQQDEAGLATLLQNAAAMVGADKPQRRLTLSIDEVIKTDQAIWRNVQGRAILQPRQWPSVLLQADLAGAPFTLEVSGDHGQPLAIRLNTDDLGTLLATYDAAIPIIDGRLDFQATGEPWALGPVVLDGRLALDNFRLGAAPVLVQTVDALSRQGLTTVNRDAGLGFDRFVADMRLSGDQIIVNEGRASGGQFGFTLGGVIDLADERLDLNGTLVPIYTLNRWIGAIPLIGTLLTGGDGEGLFAATYSVDGNFDDPDIGINPLSALAPGIIRKLLFAEQGNTRPGNVAGTGIDTNADTGSGIGTGTDTGNKSLEPPQGMVDHGG